MHEYCTACQQGALTVGHRSFRVLHLFFIPLLPIGLVTDWQCTACGGDPKLRRPFPSWIAWAGLLLGAVAFIGFSTVAWQEEDDPLTILLMLGIAAALAGFCAISLFGKKRRQHRANQESVPPLPKDNCPLCGRLTQQRSTVRCEICRIELK